jgi:acylphosphatase
MTARQVYYEGKVQGVGFRYTVKRIANGFDVVGTVRNLPDGRVELYVAGEREEVEAFLTAIEESELKSHLRGVERHIVNATPGTKGFQIVQ